MAEHQYSSDLKAAVEAARLAGAEIKAAFNAPKSVSHKGKVDLVTETDQKCEALLLERLRAAAPDYKFIGEEGSAAQGSTDALTDAPTWLVDPLDGTTNFVHRQPNVCVSIALAVQRQIVLGVVYNPITNELFTAARGHGAFLNEATRLAASEEDDPGSALLITEIGVGRDAATVEAVFDRMANLAGAVRAIRCVGSCALNLCSIAAGRADVFFEIGFGGPWDVAAGALILEEAGGAVADPAGGPFDVMARRVLGANNVRLAQAVGRIIASSKLSPAEPQPPATSATGAL